MYLIKCINFNHKTKNVDVRDGILVERLNGKIIVADEFWGSTKIYLGHSVKFSQLPKYENICHLLPYVSEFEVQPNVDYYKNFLFRINKLEAENIDGYIVFIKSGMNIETDGFKLFGRYPTEIVVVLKEENYLKFDGKTVRVLNGNLLLEI